MTTRPSEPVPAALFPVFADLRGRRVVVVGGGEVALRKVDALLEAAAQVVIAAPTLLPALQRLRDDGRVQVLHGTFQPHWLDGAWLAIAATDDPQVNRAVVAAADACRIWSNAVDDHALSRFHVPARVQRGPLQLAISSAGAAPMLARHLREQLETMLDDSLGPLTTLLQRERARIRTVLPDLSRRRAFFERVLRGRVSDLLRAGRIREARTALHVELRHSGSDAATAHASSGSVALVGAGPGDPGLLTVRALRLLNQADVILHDHLVSPQVLALARRDAQRIDVGKHCGGHATSQDRINALMLEHARNGLRVVRLKGGDPFVFGRGGEELQSLRARGIACEVVPGITAALACAAYAGIPLTHRAHAQAVTLVTAHHKSADTEPDWRALARPGQTLAIYMGVGGLARLRSSLIAHGLPANTPCALIENGSRPEQRVVRATVDTLPTQAARHQVQSPALLIIGDVAALADTLHWFGDAPLADGATVDTHAEMAA